jgi:hypothetical protein
MGASMCARAAHGTPHVRTRKLRRPSRVDGRTWGGTMCAHVSRVRIRKSCADPKTVWTNENRVRFRRACERIFRVLCLSEIHSGRIACTNAPRIRAPKDTYALIAPRWAPTFSCAHTGGTMCGLGAQKDVCPHLPFVSAHKRNFARVACAYVRNMFASCDRTYTRVGRVRDGRFQIEWLGNLREPR